MLSILKSNLLSDQTRSATAILDLHPLPTWIIERESFTIIFSNKAAVNCYGYSAEEFARFNLLNLFLEESRIRFFDRTTAGSDIADCNGEYQHCRKDGRIIIAQV